MRDMPHRRAYLKTLFFLTAAAIGLASPAQAALKTDDIPMAARLVLARAAELMNQKAYERAIQALTAFQQRGNPAPQPGVPDPKGYHHAVIYLFLGNCHLMRKAYLPAEEALSQAVARDPELVEAWLNLAKTCYEEQKYARAAECFEIAYERSHPANAESLYFCALSHLAANHCAAAVDVFQRLFQKHPDRITLHWKGHYARALLAAGRPRRALPLIRSLAEQSSGEEQTRWREMLLYQFIRLDMRSQALAYATELTRSESTRAKWWKALAHVHLSNGSARQALAALTIYSFLTPLSSEESKLWADLNLEVDIPAQAADRYNELLRHHPDKRTLQNLVLAYRRLDRSDQALAALERYVPEAKSADLLMLKADLLYDLKRYPEAEATYRCVARIKTPLAGKAWLMAGYAAWQSDDLKASRDAFEKASHDGGHRQAALLAMRQIRPGIKR
jgi:tetratricopeptide (TPR) repeat protein